MTEEKLSLEFSKLDLKQNDILIIKVDICGLDEQQATKKVASVREDEFVKFIEDSGNKVFVSYTGIDFELLRMEENDKVVSYIDVSSLSEEESEKYTNYVKFKLSESIGDKLVCVPVRNGSPKLKVEKGDKNV